MRLRKNFGYVVEVTTIHHDEEIESSNYGKDTFYMQPSVDVRRSYLQYMQVLGI